MYNIKRREGMNMDGFAGLAEFQKPVTGPD